MHSDSLLDKSVCKMTKMQMKSASAVKADVVNTKAASV